MTAAGRPDGPVLFALAAGLLGLVAGAALAGEPGGRPGAAANPYLGRPDAVSEGRQLYGRRCAICHGRGGGRGPDLHASRLSDGAFFGTVMNGRRGTQMPAFRDHITPDEVWKIHAFVRSPQQ